MKDRGLPGDFKGGSGGGEAETLPSPAHPQRPLGLSPLKLSDCTATLDFSSKVVGFVPQTWAAAVERRKLFLLRCTRDARSVQPGPAQSIWAPRFGAPGLFPVPENSFVSRGLVVSGID